MKIARSLKLLITGDTETDKLFETPPADRTENVAAVIAAESSGQFALPAATTFQLPMGGVTTAKFLLIAATSDLTVRINGGSDIVIKKATTGRALFYLEGAVSACEVENEGSSGTTVQYALGGV